MSAFETADHAMPETDGSSVVEAQTRRTAPRLGRLSALGSAAPFIWGGVAIVAVGFLLIALAWGKVAATLNVGVQMPWIISAGFTGLGLIIVGTAVANAAVRQQDASERHRQLADIRDALIELRAALDEPAEPHGRKV